MKSEWVRGVESEEEDAFNGEVTKDDVVERGRVVRRSIFVESCETVNAAVGMVSWPTPLVRVAPLPSVVALVIPDAAFSSILREISFLVDSCSVVPATEAAEDEDEEEETIRGRREEVVNETGATSTTVS